MNRMESIINEYVSGDESVRLHLFLAHRELRDAFVRIDLAASQQITSEQPARSPLRWLNRLLQLFLLIPNYRCAHLRGVAGSAAQSD